MANGQANKTKKFWKDKSEQATYGFDVKDKQASIKKAAKQSDRYSTGGGTPIEKGEDFTVVDSPREADAIREKEKNLPDSQKTNIRVKQLRDSSGRFADNASIGRGLRYESRAQREYVPVMLRDDYTATWCNKNSSPKLVTSKDSDTLLSFEMTEEEFVRRSLYYMEDTDMMATIANKGNVVMKNGKDTDKAKEKALEKRNADEHISSEDWQEKALSYKEGKGENKKKRGSWAKKAAPQPQPQPQPTNPPSQPTTPTPPQTGRNTATTFNNSHRATDGKTYSAEEMNAKLSSYNKIAQAKGWKQATPAAFVNAERSGKLAKIWNRL